MTAHTVDLASSADAHCCPSPQAGHSAAEREAGCAELAAYELQADDWDLMFNAVQQRLDDGLRSNAGTVVGTPQLLADCLHALAVLHNLRKGERAILASLHRRWHQCTAALDATCVELLQARLDEQRALHLARHDSLTDLPNRQSFSATLDGALQGSDQPAPQLAVLFLDLDGFKPINDRHGHDTGDELLRIIAARMARAVRTQDMVCRLGGDEFACIVSTPLGRLQIAHIAGKLFEAVAAPLSVRGVRLEVRPSIGIAVCPVDGEDANTLLKRADLAMYRAKRRQLGYTFFDRQVDA